MSLHDDIATYIAERSVAAWKPRTAKKTRVELQKIAAWLTTRGHRRWATVTGPDLDAYLLTMVDRGLSRATIQGSVGVLRMLGQWLAERGRVLRDPSTMLQVVRVGMEPLPPAPLSEEQVAAVFDAIPRRHVIDLRNRFHLELLYSCGLRNAEAVHLDLTDVDLDRRTVLVREGKLGKSRLLPALTGTLTAAADYLAMRRELLRGPDHGALLLDHRGQRVNEGYIAGWLKWMTRKLDFHAHPHLMRHSIAVHLLRRGADIRHIQQFLGHADLDTTKIYLRLVPGHLREDYDKAMPPLLTDDAPPASPTTLEPQPEDPPHEPAP